MKIGKMYRYINAPKGEYRFSVFRGGEAIVVLEKIWTQASWSSRMYYYKILLESGNVVDAFIHEGEWEQV